MPRSKIDHSFSCNRVCVDCDLMLFYRTYSRFCLFLDERKKAFKEAKVSPLFTMSAYDAIIIYLLQSKFEESIHFGDGPNGARLHFSIQNGYGIYI